jgi:hypothetical protein
MFLLHMPLLDPGFASIVEHSIIPLIVNMHRFQPLADALSFRIFPPDLPESFVLRFDKFQDVEQQLKRFKTGFAFFVTCSYVRTEWACYVEFSTYLNGVELGTYSWTCHLLCLHHLFCHPRSNLAHLVIYHYPL